MCQSIKYVSELSTIGEATDVQLNAIIKPTYSEYSDNLLEAVHNLSEDDSTRVFSVVCEWNYSVSKRSELLHKVGSCLDSKPCRQGQAETWQSMNSVVALYTSGKVSDLIRIYCQAPAALDTPLLTQPGYTYKDSAIASEVRRIRQKLLRKDFELNEIKATFKNLYGFDSAKCQ